MNVEKFIKDLGSKGIFLSVEGDTLKIKGKPERLDQPLLEELKRRKQEILDFYARYQERPSFSEIPVATKKNSYRLSSAQKRMYFLYELNKQSKAYNMPQVARLEGNLDKDRLQSTFIQLIARHESLRTTFELIEGEVFQKVNPYPNFEVTQLDGGIENAESVINGFITPFDLNNGPLFRVGLLKLEEKEHVLIVDMHHIITDGVSQGLLIRDFMTSYHGNELPEISLQYKDYAEWQQTEINVERLSKQKDFWINQFADEVTMLDLPTDNLRPPVRNHQGGAVSFKLDQQTSTALKDLCEEEGTTTFMLLLAIFNVLLGKLSNQEDITIGTPIAGRVHPDLDKIIGLFVNTLALRNYPKGDLTFREFLAKVKANTLLCFENQQYQYEDLIEELQVRRATDRNPLFDVMFSMQNYGQEVLSIPDLKLSPFKSGHRVSKFDLSLIATEAEENFYFSFIYATELFSSETINRFAKYFQLLVNCALTNVDGKLSDMSVLSDDEKEQLLRTFNDTVSDYPGEKSLITLFEEQVKATPTKVALTFKGQQLTFQDLSERADALGTLLVNKALPKGTVIGLMVERSFEMIVGILGILKANHTYLPIDAELSDDRISFMLEDSEASMLITDASGKERFGTEYDTIDLFIIQTTQEGRTEFPVANSDETAYIIYTSGSTGLPKGVPLSHRSVINLVTSQHELFKLKEDEIILQFSTISFDASVEQIWMSLLNGYSLALISYEQLLDGNQFNQLLLDEKITHLNTTPSFLNDVSLREPNCLRRIALGGEKCSRELLRRYSSYELYNLYGPSETCVTATAHQFNPGVDVDIIPIGKPINNVEIYILDQFQNLQPVGVTGEIYIGGDGLAKGYLNNPELTNEKFVDHPFVTGKKLYASGDLGRWRPNGEIVYLGRADTQVKVRGFRIELGEIESRLTAHDAIKEVLVTFNDESGEGQLLAYYLSENEPSEQELRTFLKKKLPVYMIPHFFIQLDQFPLTSNGKINRRLLPKPLSAPFADRTEPTTELESVLEEIWSEVLGIDKTLIGTQKSFFELGGHSLKAMVLINKIHQRLSQTIPLRQIFNSQTIRELADYLSEGTFTSFDPISKALHKERYLASPSQSRMYFLHEFDHHSLAYNMPLVVRLEGVIESGRISNAYQRLVDRYEILRTNFELVDNEVYQIITEERVIELPVVDSSPVEVDEQIRRFIRPFDLTRDSLMRMGLIEVSSTEKLLIMDMHHIITDGVSHNILIRDFVKYYGGDELSDLQLQFKDYSEWLHSDKIQQQIADDKQFWLSEFSEDWNALDLPGDKARPAIKSFDGEAYAFSFSEKETALLKALSQSEGVTLYMLLLSIFNVLLSKLSSQEEVIVGTPVSGRIHSDLDQMVGLFVNTLAIRNRPLGSQSFKDFLMAVKEKTLTCFSHQQFQYEELISALEIPRDPSRNPLFDVMFSMQNFDRPVVTLTNLKLTPYATGHKRSKFDLMLTVSEFSTQLFLNFEYSTDIFSRGTIEQFAKYFRQLTEQVVADVRQEIKHLDLLSILDKSNLLREAHSPWQKQYDDKSLIALFDEQVMNNPDKVILANNEQNITYAELNERATQLAGYLLTLSASRGEIVGIYAGKSLEAIWAMIAILKAGKAYLPLDARNPVERMRFLLEDAKIDTVLCSIPFPQELTDTCQLIEIADQANGKEVVSELKNKGQLSDLAYVIYTSGTTGKPKGVMVEQKSIIRLVRDCNYVTFQEDDVILSLSNYSFDGSIFDIYGALLNGSGLYIPNDAELLDVGLLEQIIAEKKITIFFITTALFNTLVNHEIANLGNLRYVLFGGENVSVSHVRKFKGLYPDVKLLHVYGPTENSTFSSFYEIDEVADWASTVPIGKSISGSYAYVLSEEHRLQPVGVPGEICVGGVGLSRGYLNDSELTSSKFVSDPFIPEQKIYKTGDIGRLLADGNIEFIGRKDTQVKVRGHRIELAEIETQLIRHPAIHACVVLLKTMKDTRYLTAYYEAERELATDILKEFLTKSLPDYMIPQFICFLKQLPLNKNGKVDRTLLPEPTPKKEENYVPPSNELEEQLVAIWSEVIQMDKEAISVQTNFFELGGNSLKILQLKALIKAQMGLDISVPQLFRFTTIEAQVSYISQAESQAKLVEEEIDDEVSGMEDLLRNLN